MPLRDLEGKSRTCPTLAWTSKVPRLDSKGRKYFWMVLAFAGLSTITRLAAFLPPDAFELVFFLANGDPEQGG